MPHTLVKGNGLQAVVTLPVQPVLPANTELSTHRPDLDELCLFWGSGLSKGIYVKLTFTVSLTQAIEHAIATSGQANKRALARKHLIEKRKEEQERLLLEQEREQEEQRMIQLRISEEAEDKRRKADM